MSQVENLRKRYARVNGAYFNHEHSSNCSPLNQWACTRERALNRVESNLRQRIVKAETAAESLQLLRIGAREDQF